MIKTTLDWVFHGGGRRWLTLDGACNAEARARIKERCECDPGEPAIGIGPYVCEYHDDVDRYNRIIGRLSAGYKRRFKRLWDE